MFKLTTAIPLHTTLVAAGLLIYVLATRARQQRRHPYAAIAWVLGIAAFPYLGLPIYLVFGTRKIVRPATRSQPVPAGPWSALAPAWSTRLLAALGTAEARPQAAVRLHADGPHALQELRDLLASAHHTLDICTYVLSNDQTGTELAGRLAERARAGVRVRLLVDGVGSVRGGRSHDAVLQAAGVEVQRFMPALQRPGRGRANLRNHRKLVVADGLRLWAGGRNLADEYFIGQGGQPAWVDLSFTAHGALATQAMALFEGDWRLAAGRVRHPRTSYAERARRYDLLLRNRALGEGDRQALRSTAAQTEQDVAAAQPASPLAPDEDFSIARAISLAQWVPSGPDFHEDILHALLVSAAFHAEQCLMLVTPYFVPDEGLTEALLLAAKRGVRVTLVLPARSNHRLADWARGRSVRLLASNGVDVRLVPGMLHAKAVVMDDVLALCGSANLDGRSLFINYEAMAAFYGHAEIEWLTRWIGQQAARGQPASAAPPGLARDILEGLIATVAFQL
ncbi:MAG TPA: phospholipase D-like domain-containing protein [Ottowia sp.]|uniref:phospholipase D-like domain-containing protein n=1 Tax=Ottowia sp. TaxID=1898956 RepID=UPI002D0FFDD7|nr:phospholipase D-like domain-containing protein [Ottowia sp.]HMN21437.1 phospholipase D-like domain-containing protein [Ottowia sp.]